MVEISDDNFEKEVIESSKEKPVLVDFWASWCPPCQILGPILEKIEKKYKDKIKIAKLNIEENKQKSAEYNISSIPAVKLFKQGKVIDEFVGLRSEQDLKAWMDNALQ